MFLCETQAKLDIFHAGQGVAGTVEAAGFQEEFCADGAASGPERADRAGGLLVCEMVEKIAVGGEPVCGGGAGVIGPYYGGGSRICV